jgi:hypothetical protein
MQTKRSAPTIRPGAYTDPVSPLIPVDPAPPKRRRATEGRGLLLLLWLAGFILLANAHAGVPAALWLLLGWYAAVYGRA